MTERAYALYSYLSIWYSACHRYLFKEWKSLTSYHLKMACRTPHVLDPNHLFYCSSSSNIFSRNTEFPAATWIYHVISHCHVFPHDVSLPGMSQLPWSPSFTTITPMYSQSASEFSKNTNVSIIEFINWKIMLLFSLLCLP